MKNLTIFFALCIIALSSCKAHKEKTARIKKQPPQRQQPKAIQYQFAKAKDWLIANKVDSNNVAIVVAVNRTDNASFAKLDTVIIPTDMSGDIAYYMHFPLNVPYLDTVDKIIFFSYPSQTFGAYENGVLIYTGPTNMGRKKDPTPTGLFFANWKAEKTISTVNDEWELLWNFNIANKDGVGWHQYSLPGYPASHSCLRLQEKDARYLYTWADQWALEGTDNILANGTPAIVFGSYNFDGPKPWWQLVANPHALDISEADIQKQTMPYLDKIIAEQTKRETLQADKE